MYPQRDEEQQTHQPVFNVPGVVILLLAIMLFVQLLRVYVLDAQADRELILQFAFIPCFSVLKRWKRA